MGKGAGLRRNIRVLRMEFAWAVDALVGVLILVSAYLAMVRGLVRELFALASWAVAFFAAFFFAPSLQPMLADLPAVGSVLSDCPIAMVVAFIIVFGLTLIVTGAIIWMFSGGMRDSGVGVVDQGLGFIYGALRGLVLVAVIYIAYQQIVPESEEYAFVENAYSIGFVKELAETIQSMLPEDPPDWFRERAEQLMGQCGGEGI